LVYSTPDHNYANVEELRGDKNNIFMSILKKIEFLRPYGKISHEIVNSDNETCLIRLAVDRPTKLRTPDFKTSVFDDWPWIFIYVDNNPKNQFLVIEVNREAWSSERGLVNMLQSNFNDVLREYFLMVEIEPIIEKNAFWEFVEKHKGQIEVVEFDMISPNMSNISAKSKWPLQQIRDEYNATKQTVRLENTAGTSMDIKNDELINSLAEYSSAGCGTTKFKVRGIKGYKSLSDDKIKFEVESIDVESENSDIFIYLVKKIRDSLRKL
jgi:hypothetical protein